MNKTMKGVRDEFARREPPVFARIEGADGGAVYLSLEDYIALSADDLKDARVTLVSEGQGGEEAVSEKKVDEAFDRLALSLEVAVDATTRKVDASSVVGYVFLRLARELRLVAEEMRGRK